MIQINFYPEGDKEEHFEATKEYQNIWDKEGIKIIEAIQKKCGLSFKEGIVRAIIFEGASRSNPLKLRSSYNADNKKSVLVHELVHRILVDNNIKIPGGANFKEDLHKAIYLVLYDIWADLFGENFAMASKDRECILNSAYKKAWSWALSFPKEERAKKFKEITLKYQKT